MSTTSAHKRGSCSFERATPEQEQITSIPWGIVWTKDDCVPLHDVVGIGRPVDTLRGVLLQPFEVPHQPLHKALAAQRNYKPDVLTLQRQSSRMQAHQRVARYPAGDKWTGPSHLASGSAHCRSGRCPWVRSESTTAGVKPVEVLSRAS